MRHCRPSIIRRALPHTRRRPHPGLYRPKNEYADCSEERTHCCKRISRSAHPVHIHFRTHEPAPCCDPHQLPGQCGKQGPRVGALHRLIAAREEDTSAISLQPLGRTPALAASHRQDFTTADLPRQVPKSDILSETDCMLEPHALPPLKKSDVRYVYVYVGAVCPHPQPRVQ